MSAYGPHAEGPKDGRDPWLAPAAASLEARKTPSKLRHSGRRSRSGIHANGRSEIKVSAEYHRYQSWVLTREAWVPDNASRLRNNEVWRMTENAKPSSNLPARLNAARGRPVRSLRAPAVRPASADCCRASPAASAAACPRSWRPQKCYVLR